MKKTFFIMAVIAIATTLISCKKEDTVKPVTPSIVRDTVKVEYILSGYRETLYPAVFPDTISSASLTFQIMVRIKNETDSTIYFSYPEYDAFHIEPLYDTARHAFPISVSAVADVANISYQRFKLDPRTSGVVSYNSGMSTVIPTVERYQLQLREFKYSLNGNDNIYESFGVMDSVYHSEWVNP